MTHMIVPNDSSAGKGHECMSESVCSSPLCRKKKKKTYMTIKGTTHTFILVANKT